MPFSVPRGLRAQVSKRRRKKVLLPQVCQGAWCLCARALRGAALHCNRRLSASREQQLLCLGC
eukprot:11143503-Alexandrium_andersonii.AAC.1